MGHEKGCKKKHHKGFDLGAKEHFNSQREMDGYHGIPSQKGLAMQKGRVWRCKRVWFGESPSEFSKGKKIAGEDPQVPQNNEGHLV